MKKITKLLFVSLLILTSLVAFLSFSKAPNKVNSEEVINNTDVTYETPDEITIRDLKVGGTSVGSKKTLVAHTTYSYDATAEHKSVVFKFKYEITTSSNASCQFHFSDTWLAGNGGVFWFTGDKLHISKPGGTTYVSVNSPFSGVGTYDCELGKLYIASGTGAGNYYLYVKVGEALVTEYTIASMPEKANVFMSGTNGDVLYDIDYVAPSYEDADVISINDLNSNGTYLDGTYELSNPGLNIFTFGGSSKYGSVVFKGTFNFSATNFTNGDNHGTQVRFDDGWSTEGMFWFHPNGILMPNGTGYIVGSKISTGTDVSVEIGRLAIMNGDNFSGSHYFYVKLDGILAVEYTSSSVPKETYNKKCISFTGKVENGINCIKNIAINKKVTVKVNNNQEDINVLRSGLVSIPEYNESIVGTDKRILGWKIEGTSEPFSPLTDRVYNDMVIVAEIVDFKWKVTFDGVEYLFNKNEEITIPETNPTKAFENDKHFVFSGWEDNNGVAFVEGTKATADMVFVSKYTEEAHSLGEYEVTVEPGCATAGTKTRSCSCGYSEQETIPAGHKLIHHEATPATCGADGNKEHYSCSGCDKYFSDQAATTEITDIILPKHGLTHHEAVVGTCSKNGTVEYYECETCHKYYSDEAATTELQSIASPKVHNLSKVNKEDATCLDDGHIEYYHCRSCGKNFADEEGKSELADVSIPSTGHKYGDDSKCEVCGEKDPYYVEPVKKGCSSSVSISIIMSLSLLTFTGIIYKKKKENI